MKKILDSEGRFTFLELEELQRACRFKSGIVYKIRWIIDLFLLKKKVVRQVRKDESFPKDKLAELFLMLVGYARYKRIDLQSAITKAYPNFCVYCEKKPCKCGAPGVSRPLFRVDVDKEDPLLTLSAFQKRDFEVYPNDRSFAARLIRACHLSEEADEFLVEFLLEFINTPDIGKITEEVTDFLERIISLASTLEIDLGKEIALYLNSLSQ